MGGVWFSIRHDFKITDWLAANKLSLNASKTKFMVFHSDKKIVRYPKLFINDVKIERVDCFNFLGMQLNHSLKWNKHINHRTIAQIEIEISHFYIKVNIKYPAIATYQLLYFNMGLTD